MARLERLRHGLSAREWTGLGGMAGAVLLLHVVGFSLLFAAAAHHFHQSSAKGMVFALKAQPISASL